LDFFSRASFISFCLGCSEHFRDSQVARRNVLRGGFRQTEFFILYVYGYERFRCDITTGADQSSKCIRNRDGSLGLISSVPVGAEVIYRETFGIAPGATTDSFATAFDWQRFDANGLEITTTGTSSGVNFTVAGRPVDVANVNAGPNNDGTFGAYTNGILYLGATPSPSVALTTEYSFNPADYAPGSVVFKWYQGDNTAPHTFRLLVRVGSQWYASETVFTTPAVPLASFGTQSELKTLTYNSARTNWQSVNFDGDYTVGSTAGSGTTKDSTVGALSLTGTPSADLSGPITGFGVYGTNGESATGNRRIDSFTIEATPQASTGSVWRLIGITGQQSDDTLDAQNNFVHPDNTLFEINLTNATVTKLFRTTWDSQDRR
jgi:hypothetical protein